MIEGAHPLIQATLGGCLTWGLTALGAASVFIFHSQNKKLLDASLGFAAGVMTAASFWSLLAPGIERAQEQMGGSVWSFVPIAIGFACGAGFVWGCDALLPFLGFASDDMVAAFIADQPRPEREPSGRTADVVHSRLHPSRDSSGDRAANMEMVVVRDGGTAQSTVSATSVRRRRRTDHPEPPSSPTIGNGTTNEKDSAALTDLALSWRRVLLLIIAITVHNIPEGLAVGVAFGAIGATKSATFSSAMSLAIGIGIQNYPEGMAVALPLRGFGYSRWRAFFYGQLSGVVEPIAAVFGAVLVTVAEPILPYALAFAAGAMIFVVFDDIIPEAQMHGNGRLSSIAAIIGFIIMMSLDVSLG